jgi:hypothetical protein
MIQRSGGPPLFSSLQASRQLTQRWEIGKEKQARISTYAPASATLWSTSIAYRRLYNRSKGTTAIRVEFDQLPRMHGSFMVPPGRPNSMGRRTSRSVKKLENPISRPLRTRSGAPHRAGALSQLMGRPVELLFLFFSGFLLSVFFLFCFLFNRIIWTF